MKITICINTFNRNKNLCNLLKSIEKIYLLNSYVVKILIIDNTVNNNSYSFIQKFKSNYKFEITHINEKKNGIVYSRNKCLKYLKTTSQDYICLFDDDCTIDKFWLKHVINTIKIYKAKIVSGPQIHYKKNNSINLNYKFIYQKFFEKNYTHEIKKIKWAATNNIFMNYNILKKNNLYFDTNLNKFKIGEDQLFFLMLNKNKNCIYWNKKAIVYEKIHENRTGIKWLVRRSFKLGVLGHYIDIKLHGKFFGLLLNYLKSIYYLLKSIFFLMLMYKKIYIVNSANNLARFYGRTIGIFVFKRIKF
jgi:succinoglycan biosynthesis protein ExoM